MASATLEQRPRVGIGVLVMRNGKVLLGKRKGSHGAGEYAWPGGHLEFGESIHGCAEREVAEETGMAIQNIRFLRIMNLRSYGGTHYLDVGLVADWKSGEPVVLEPNKCEGWAWYDLDHLPAPLFATVPSDVEALKSGQTFFDVV